MIIKKTITEYVSREVETEVTFPIYKRFLESFYYMAIDDQTCVRACSKTSIPSIERMPFDCILKEDLRDSNEEEFRNEFSAALKELTKISTFNPATTAQ